ncbi:hypothetical protein BT96DRAFT_1100677 [Gymnopus androsaceus JB14]|uniref:Uncharacterized protein n=1 Tax=Gymnopus androsaceus JB14 TaxID=1447944 RepID=A0A6A4HN54_9AGAR|nr:hypothetical protein BT96DRAFT_1100677 [Gymnopus androsaceus JB14]
MSPSLPNLKILSTHASVDDLKPINSFRLFTEYIFFQTTHLEHMWGLEKGQLDLWSSLNHISEVLDQMMELIQFNKNCSLNERRRAFKVLPPKKYEYRLITVTDPPPTIFASGLTSCVEPLLCIYPDFPLVKLNVHPAFAMIHTLPDPNASRDDSSEGGTIYEDDPDSEAKAVKIHSWLNKTDGPSSSPVQGISLGETLWKMLVHGKHRPCGVSPSERARAER